MMRRFLVLILLAGLFGSGPATAREDTLHPLKEPPLDPREVHLSGLLQLTHRGENAEAYWSPDGTELILQSTRPPYACDQIFRQRADGTGTPILVSTGKGRTTCSYFLPDGKRVLFSSTHAAGPECPLKPDRSHGYVWAVYPTYEIYSAKPDGSDLVRLTDNNAYDAEATVCSKDGSVIFTSTRDGDLDLYRMDSDGKNVKRLTDTPGYDGGAFFSPDCSQIVWRASRPRPGPEMEEYKRLLAQGLVHPTQLEIWIANADGSDARQVTYLGAASFGPSFFPSGKRLLFSSNYGDPQGREFDIWAVNTDGTGLERITWTSGFDGFPLFSPDGSRLAFSSSRNQSEPGEMDVYVARWVDRQAAASEASASSPTAAAERFRDDVGWLADDAREGRGIGTRGLDEASRWLARRFREMSLESVGGDGYFQRFEVPVAVAARPGTAVTVNGAAVARDSFQPASFSSNGVAAGPVVAAGYGITAPELGIDDYKGVEAKGKIVVVRRFTPEGGPFAQKEAQLRYGDLRYKAWNAREHGAQGLIVVDLPAAGTLPAEAPLPSLAIDRTEAMGSDAGLPVVTLKREAGAKLFAGSHQATLKIDLERRTQGAVNVVGVIRATSPDRLPGAVLVGAHYDHLGRGGAASLAPDSHDVHHGADDNASGTAALLEVARQLDAERTHLRRDVYFVAFSGEEAGVLGSTAFTKKPPAGIKTGDLVAMLNMDMVGRLRGNQVTVLGGESAAEWKEIVPPACEHSGVLCTLSGDGYGPSDHSPFYAAGVPVLHFFTGAHADYHRPSDDAGKINAAGGARIAGLVASIAERLSDQPGRPTYKSAPSPAPQGDSRSYGASLGTVPDYAGDGRPGVLLAGVRPGGAAEAAGIQRGDLLVELGGKEIRDIHDFMYVLESAKPGEKTTAVVVRGGQRMTVAVTFGTSRR